MATGIGEQKRLAMKWSFSVGIAFLLGVCLLSACSSNKDEQPLYGSVVITQPTTAPNYTIYSNSVTLGGGVDYLDNGTLSQISISWSNAATGNSGNATVSVFCLIGCSISWATPAIPLVVGDNIITISALGNPGHVFSPSTITVTRLPIFEVSGYVADPYGAAFPDVRLDLNGQVAYTDANGNFSFQVYANGLFTIIPSVDGPSGGCFSFSPSSLTVSVSGSSVTGQNFAAISKAPCYAISGRITDQSYNRNGVSANVFLTGSSGNRATTTDANGYYQFRFIPNGTYTITPENCVTYPCKTFSPSSLTATVNGADLTGQDFYFLY